MVFSAGRKMSRWRQEWFTGVFLTYFLSNLTQSHVSEKDFLLWITEPIQAKVEWRGACENAQGVAFRPARATQCSSLASSSPL